MAGLDFSMLQSAATRRTALVDADDVEFESEHPTTFALAPVRDVRSLICFCLSCCFLGRVVLCVAILFTSSQAWLT